MGGEREREIHKQKKMYGNIRIIVLLKALIIKKLKYGRLEHMPS